MATNLQNQTGGADLKKLLLNQEFTKVPKAGDVVKGKVIYYSKSEVRIDLDAFKTGLVRGIEVADIKTLYPNLKVGDEVEATVLELENETGEVELSFRYMGERRGWTELEKSRQENLIVDAKIIDANHGGLMATIGHQIIGFIPVSQLSPDHYPRVPGGDKIKILEKLREFIGKNLRVRVLDANSNEQKLIFSEKIVWEEEQKGLLSKYKIGDIIQGKVTALADFGAFIAFSTGNEGSPKADASQVPASGGEELEGLVHISEIAWQRLDHPSDSLKIGDEVKAKIIGMEGAKIFLSIRQLVDDPWQKINEKYNIGQIVKGKVLKINPFGLFVEIDPEIHGLAHVSELELGPEEKLESKIKPGDELEFKIVSIEPIAHRLGLSQKALKAPGAKDATEEPAAAPEEPKT